MSSEEKELKKKEVKTKKKKGRVRERKDRWNARQLFINDKLRPEDIDINIVRRADRLLKLFGDYNFILRLAYHMQPLMVSYNYQEERRKIDLYLPMPLFRALNEYFTKHAKVRIKHRTTYLRYLILLGLVLDAAYHDEWNKHIEEAVKVLTEIDRLALRTLFFKVKNKLANSKVADLNPGALDAIDKLYENI